ncbi:hypothetical protein Tco_1262064 [Tanacetum coccineum]
MFGLFGWLASIKQGMLEPVKVKCIFLGYRKGFNESREYNKTFIGSGVCTGSVQVFQGVEFEVEPHKDHALEVEPLRNVGQGAGSLKVQTQDFMDYHSARDKEQHSVRGQFMYRADSNEVAFVVAAMEEIYAHESFTFDNTVACEVISKWKDGLKKEKDDQSDVYVLSNGYGMVSSCGCKAKIRDTKGLLHEAKDNILEGHSILSLEVSLSGDCDVEKNEHSGELEAIWGFAVALDEPTPVVAEPEADSLAIESTRAIITTDDDTDSKSTRVVIPRLSYSGSVHVFSVMTLQDPTTGAWIMDTGSLIVRPAGYDIIASLHQEFSMTDLRPLNYFLGIFVVRGSSGMFLS